MLLLDRADLSGPCRCRRGCLNLLKRLRLEQKLTFPVGDAQSARRVVPVRPSRRHEARGSRGDGGRR